MSLATQTADAPDIAGMPKLLDRMDSAETVRDWSFILSDYLSFGNNKLADTIAVFNMGSATDCVNRGTEHCQVGKNECYATKSENRYAGVKSFRDRQEYLWDAMDAETFAHAFLTLVDRKHNPVDTLRFNVAGDFRCDSDVIRADRVAEILQDNGITVYTYSASDYLDWTLAEHLTVNGSNSNMTEADQQFIVAGVAGVPDDGFVCPGECGPCRACMHPGGDDEIYVEYH